MTDPEHPALYEPEDELDDEYEPDAYRDGFEFYNDEALFEL